MSFMKNLLSWRSTVVFVIVLIGLVGFLKESADKSKQDKQKIEQNKKLIAPTINSILSEGQWVVACKFYLPANEASGDLGGLKVRLINASPAESSGSHLFTYILKVPFQKYNPGLYKRYDALSQGQVASFEPDPKPILDAVNSGEAASYLKPVIHESFTVQQGPHPAMFSAISNTVMSCPYWNNLNQQDSTHSDNLVFTDVVQKKIFVVEQK